MLVEHFCCSCLKKRLTRLGHCVVRRLGENSCSGEGDVSDGECRADEVGGGGGGGQARTVEPDGGSFLHFIPTQCLSKKYVGSYSSLVNLGFDKATTVWNCTIKSRSPSLDFSSFHTGIFFGFE